MIYQLRWRIEPGLRGLSCSGFEAAEIPPGRAPENERGVAVEFSSEAERGAFLKQLEEHFASPRFSNNATAFETVKSYVLEWAAHRK
jgi:hypothetical protein